MVESAAAEMHKSRRRRRRPFTISKGGLMMMGEAANGPIPSVHSGGSDPLWHPR